MIFIFRHGMLESLKDIASMYTPMVWNKERKQYDIDFDSAELLGY